MSGVRNGQVGGLKGVSTPERGARDGQAGFQQEARRRVTEAVSAQRKERLEQERRLADLAVAILTAIAERDEAVHSAEQQAADAVRALIAVRLSIAEITELCAGQIDAKELTRLSRLPAEPVAASGVKS